MLLTWKAASSPSTDTPASNPGLLPCHQLLSLKTLAPGVLMSERRHMPRPEREHLRSFLGKRVRCGAEDFSKIKNPW